MTFPYPITSPSQKLCHFYLYPPSSPCQRMSAFGLPPPPPPRLYNIWTAPICMTPKTFYLSMILIFYFSKLFIPIWSTSISSLAKTGDQVSFVLNLSFQFWLSHLFTFLCSRSIASCKVTAFISVLCKAEVMKRCISRNLDTYFGYKNKQ